MSEWISVEDRLPEPFVNVFVYPQAVHYGTVWEADIDLDGKWHIELEDPYQIIHKEVSVTHWMPRPDDPE